VGIKRAYDDIVAPLSWMDDWAGKLNINPGLIIQFDLSAVTERASTNRYLLLAQLAGAEASSITKLNIDRLRL